MRSIPKILTTTFLAFCFLSAPAFAQVSGGVVTGRVTDATGANLPNVTIELENIDTGQRITLTTDASGVYTFSNVPAGRYRIITSGGSRSAVPTQEVTVDIGRTNTINIAIPSGPRTDVQASAEAVPITLKPASILKVWETRYLAYQPEANFVGINRELFGGYNLAVFTEAQARVPGLSGGQAFAGQRPSTNMFHVNGIDNENRLTGGPLVYVSNEATTEFNLFQNQPTPLFGHSGGAKYNSIVQTGTNRFHGSVYNYLQNRWFNAVDQRFAAFGFNDDNEPRYDQNRLGGSVGLPIVPSKVFFFGNFEYIPLGFQAPMGGAAFAPTQAGLDLLGNTPAVSASNLGILRSALGNNVPTEQTGLLGIGGAAVPVGRFTPLQNHWRNAINATGSLDFNMNENDQFRFRYVHNHTDATFFNSNPLQTRNFQRSLLANASHYHNFTSRVTNELRFGYNRIDAEQYMQNDQPSISIANQWGLNLGANRMPAGIVNTYHVADTVAFNFRSHSLRIGYDGRRVLGFRDNFAAFGPGAYGYSSLGRFLTDLSPDVYAQRGFGTNRLDLGHWMHFGFVQDNWRVNNRLSLDLGVRYNYSGVPRGFRNMGMNGQIGVPGLVDFNEPTPDALNFAPYVGIAFSPWSNRTVIRSSFGMWYDNSFWQRYTGSYAPFLLSGIATGNLTSNAPGFLAGGGLADPTGANPRAGVTGLFGEMETPYNMQWNLAIQQALSDNTTLEVKYLGNRGVHQPVWQQLNAMGATADRSLPLFTDTPSQAQLNGLGLTLNQLQTPVNNEFFAAGFRNPINTIGFGGLSYYHGAVASVNQRFSRGFQMKANYTWSRWEDTATGTPLDLGRTERSRTWSMFDRRHQVNVAGMFGLAGLFPNMDWAGRVFADFNLSGSYQFATSPFLTPVSANNTAALLSGASGAFVNPNASGLGVSQLNPLRNTAGSVVAYQVANPNARFISPAAGVFTGYTGPSLPLDDLHNVNLALSKRFGVTEGAAIELRGEAYNLFNRSNVVGYNPMSLGTGFAPPIGPIPGTFDVNNISNLSLMPSNARMVQLALRLTF